MIRSTERRVKHSFSGSERATELYFQCAPALVKHLQRSTARLGFPASMIWPTEQRRRFSFERDTFTFANELYWEYRFDPATGATTTITNNPPPTYAHRCFVMVRSARQFFYHARFEPTAPRAEEAVCRRLIGEVVSRSPRRLSAEAERVIIPGYDCLRAFSAANASLLKAVCGKAWESYFVRSHWRMVFPI
jgi:hypothetical protein